MPKIVTLYRILIASPSDCSEERRIIPEIIDDWNSAHSPRRSVVLEPVMWESHARPELGDRPQEIINRQLLDCDFLVGVFWSRLGTATGKAVSGTVEEIERQLNSGKKVLLYFSNVAIPPNRIDLKQYEALNAYRAEVEKLGIAFPYNSVDEFRRLFFRNLASLMEDELARPAELTVETAINLISENTYLWLDIEDSFTGATEFALDEEKFKVIKSALDALVANGKLKYQVTSRSIDTRRKGKPFVRLKIQDIDPKLCREGKMAKMSSARTQYGGR